MNPSPASEAPLLVRRTYLNAPDTGLRSWLLTLDHKRIGVMFLIATTVAFILGGIFALLIRIELLTPGPTIMDAMTYNRMFTLHGVVMIFLFMIPAIPSGFGNFLLPIMLGAKDVAFPRLNLLSFYLYLARRGGRAVRDDPRRRGHRLDLLHAVLDDHGDQGRAGPAGRVHHRVLLDPHRPQLHRHDAHDARAGAHLGPDAALRLGRSTRRA